MMKNYSIIFSSLLVAFFLVFGTAGTVKAGALLMELENALMCKCDDKCGKVLINCTCATSDETRGKFSKLLESGLTVDQIIQQQVDKYGETVLSSPTKTGFNLTAWMMPFAMLLAGGLGITKIIDLWIKKKKGVGGDSSGQKSDSVEKDTVKKYSSRLQDELDRIEL
jgi:cytochrome c-type biogenesis protein CcmH